MVLIQQQQEKLEGIAYYLSCTPIKFYLKLNQTNFNESNAYIIIDNFNIVNYYKTIYNNKLIQNLKKDLLIIKNKKETNYDTRTD